MIRLPADPGVLCTGRSPAGRAPAISQPVEIDIAAASLLEVRQVVAGEAQRGGMQSARVEDFVLAVDELVTNSVMYGGGSGELRIWWQAGEIVCEVHDRGHILDPLVGRRPPRPRQPAGRGLWIAGQLCDRLEISSRPRRTIARVRMRR